MYRVLYRKYRPQRFSDVVGQQHITDTILSQINENKVAHAYLFTGSRGTGKTTCAKIFAKAVNCPNAADGEPCNCCEVCSSIDNGSNLDVVEMDAASNRNLEDIKEVLDEVNYPPNNSKFRVYIIDEVHMLTNFAFNALLKTLEEPPEYVRFVLATTEVQKMPATILSRCQRFDFRRIEPEVIARRLMKVAENEGGSIDEDAGEYIAKIADGGMRDSLSLLDRCLSITNHVTGDIVAQSAGLIGREYLYDLLRAVGAHDTAKCLNILDSLHRNSCDTERLCADLTECFRNFLVLKTVNAPEKLIVCTQSELNTIREVASLFSSEGVIYSLGVLSKTAESIRNSGNRRIEAEMAFVRLCSPETDNGTQALLERISRLEAELAALKKNGVPASSVPAGPSVRRENVTDRPSQTAAAPVRTAAPEQKAEPSPADNKPAPAENKPAPAENKPVPAENKPAPAEKKTAPAFAGFAAAVSGGGGFASAFDSLGDEDDEPMENKNAVPAGDEPASVKDDGDFDFESFMASAADNSDDEPAFDIPSGESFFDDAPPPDDSFAPPDDGFIPDIPEEYAPEPRPETPPRQDDRAQSAAVSRGGTPVERSAWMSVVQKVEATNFMFIGQLTGSSAEIRGDNLIVTITENLLLPRDVAVKAIGAAAEERLGKKYTVKLEGR